MTSLLMPTPDRRRPELVASLRLFRAELEHQRRFHLDQLARLTGERRPFQYPPGADDDAQADQTRRKLGDIETALNRIRTHRYGFCLYCGAELPIDRLRARPDLDACDNCR